MEQKCGWERLFTPRPQTVLYITGVPEFHDVAMETYWFQLSAFAARLPPKAQELLVDYGILNVRNPSASRAFGVRNRGTRMYLEWEYDREWGRDKPVWRVHEWGQRYFPGRLGIADGITSGQKIAFSAEQCRELYDTCKDDERALLLLQQHGIIGGVVTPKTLAPSAVFFGCDGEEIPPAYETAYNRPNNRTYALETILPKREMQRKKRGR